MRNSNLGIVGDSVEVMISIDQALLILASLLQRNGLMLVLRVFMALGMDRLLPYLLLLRVPY